MEENMAKFEEKLKELVALGKKKKSVLELQEINDFFSDMELTSEQMEKVYDYLEANNVDVLRIGADDDDDIDDADIVISDEDEVDMEKIDLSVPDGISIEDPVRMYLKEIAAGGGQSSSGGQHCPALGGPGDAVPGSDPGRKPGTYQGSGEVRLS